MGTVGNGPSFHIQLRSELQQGSSRYPLAKGRGKLLLNWIFIAPFLWRKAVLWDAASGSKCYWNPGSALIWPVSLHHYTSPAVITGDQD